MESNGTQRVVQEVLDGVAAIADRVKRTDEAEKRRWHYGPCCDKCGVDLGRVTSYYEHLLEAIEARGTVHLGSERERVKLYLDAELAHFVQVLWSHLFHGCDHGIGLYVAPEDGELVCGATPRGFYNSATHRFDTEGMVGIDLGQAVLYRGTEGHAKADYALVFWKQLRATLADLPLDVTSIYEIFGRSMSPGPEDEDEDAELPLEMAEGIAVDKIVAAIDAVIARWSKEQVDAPSPLSAENDEFVHAVACALEKKAISMCLRDSTWAPLSKYPEARPYLKAAAVRTAKRVCRSLRAACRAIARRPAAADTIKIVRAGVRKATLRRRVACSQ